MFVNKLLEYAIMSNIGKHVTWKRSLLLLTTALTLLARGYRTPDDQLLERVRRDAPAAWEQARAAQESLLSPGNYEVQHRTRHWHKDLADRPPYSVTNNIQVLDVDHRRYLKTDSTNTNSIIENLIVVNPYYNFGLVRNSTEAPWTVEETHRSNDNLSQGPYGLFVSSNNHAGLGNVSGVSFGFNDILLQDQNDLDIKTANRVSYKGLNAVKCEFLLPVPVTHVDAATGDAKEVYRPTNCYAILEPEMNWAVLEFSMTLDSSNTISAKYSNERTETGVVFRSKSHEESYVDGVLTEWVIKENSIRKLSLTREEFTLSSYGFPEPDGYRPPRPWWLYTSVVGVVIFLVGIVVMKLGRRLQRH